MFDSVSLSKIAFCLDQGTMIDKLYFFLCWNVFAEIYNCTSYRFFLVSAAL